MSHVGFGSGSTGGSGTTPIPKTNQEKLFGAADLATVFAWYDQGFPEERIKSIIYSSASQRLVARKDFTWVDETITGNAFFFPDHEVSQVLTVVGGTVEGPDGRSSIVVPGGILSGNTVFTISVELDTKISLTPDGLSLIASATFGLSRTFSSPITLTFPLRTRKDPGVYDLYIHETVGDTWPLSGTMTVDDSGTFATAQVTRL
jgi:hypothetical protein